MHIPTIFSFRQSTVFWRNIEQRRTAIDAIVQHLRRMPISVSLPSSLDHATAQGVRSDAEGYFVVNVANDQYIETRFDSSPLSILERKLVNNLVFKNGRQWEWIARQLDS